MHAGKDIDTHTYTPWTGVTWGGEKGLFNVCPACMYVYVHVHAKIYRNNRFLNHMNVCLLSKLNETTTTKYCHRIKYKSGHLLLILDN